MTSPRCLSNMSSKPFVVLFGPTASGKSALAMHLAKHLDGVIVNADSRQIFQGLPTLSACPTPSDTQNAPHQLYEILPWSLGPINAHDWAQRASSCIEKNNLSVVTGGTGFYINTLIHGISPITPINPKLSAFLKMLCATPLRAHTLHTLLKKWDPNITFHANNTVYLHRALCIAIQTRQKPSSLKSAPQKTFTRHKPFVIKILPHKAHVDAAIAARAQSMMDHGVVDEVLEFHKQHDSNPPVLGFDLLLQCANGTISAENALKQLIYATRQYAKRQLSFGRHHIQGHMTWPTLFCAEQWKDFYSTFLPLWTQHTHGYACV